MSLLRRDPRLLLLAVLLAIGCAAPPRSLDPGPRIAAAELDASGFDALLRAHVRDGRVAYPGFEGEPALERYLDGLAAVELTGAPREVRLALLINAYNALAIDGILDGTTPETLLGRYRYFLRTRHALAGERITLWDLEHERIRPLGEPRIHFAIVCASTSCPELRAEAWDAARLETQLELATRDFVNDPSKNRFDEATRTAELSAIFDWYREDFEISGETLVGYVARYVDDPQLAAALRTGDWKVRFLPYDWSLNGEPPGSD